MIKRLSEYLKSVGLTITWLESECGFAKGTLSKALKNETHIGTDKLYKILVALPELNLRWLILNTGEMTLDKIKDDFGVKFIDKAEYFSEKLAIKEYENMGMRERIKELESKIEKLKSNELQRELGKESKV
jgi:transcriptional regulator with XRE-family HTH domain